MSVSPVSGWVLSAAAVVASPALWDSLVVGTMPIDVALTRFLIAVPVSWLLLTLVSELAFPGPATGRTAEVGEPAAEPAPDPLATDQPDAARSEVDPAA